MKFKIIYLIGFILLLGSSAYGACIPGTTTAVWGTGDTKDTCRYKNIQDAEEQRLEIEVRDRRIAQKRYKLNNPSAVTGPQFLEAPTQPVNRPGFEIGFGVDFAGKPDGGNLQFGVANYTFRFIHNFSPVFNIYGSYSSANIEKRSYDDPVYDKSWGYQSLIFGLGFYPHPFMEIFGGLGKVQPTNSKEIEELGMAVEIGTRFHWQLNQGYTLALGFIYRAVPLAEEGGVSTRNRAVGDINHVRLELIIPVGD